MGNEIRCGVLSTNVYNKMVYNLTIDRRIYILLAEFSCTSSVLWFHKTNNHDHQTHNAMAI